MKLKAENVKAGKRIEIEIPIKHSIKRKLKKAGKGKADIEATATDAAGNVGTASVSVDLK